MSDTHQSQLDIEATIRTKLIELIRLSVELGIRIETLMHEALAICDPESG